MNLNLYVHDCFLEIGHSNAAIETLRNVDPNIISSLTIVAYTSDNPEKLFPELIGKVQHHKVPFTNLKPILIKVIFFHIYTFFYCLFHPRSTKISIGIASLCADIINIQFIHSHWEDLFFKQRKLSPLTILYKKILFLYFRICESYLYRKKKMKFSSLSRYVTNFCLNHFKLRPEQIKTIYSAVNLTRYTPSHLNRIEIYKELHQKYPQLEKINPAHPIFLFVGAYERKGLPDALKALEKIHSPQIIIIGRPEKGSKLKIPAGIISAQIEYTRDIHHFYQLCDNFIFPTFYEPYGLVITEAAATGMRLYTTTKNVGATELLHNLAEIFLFETPDQLTITNNEIISPQQRIALREERIEKVFSQYSWESAGKQFQQLLTT